MRPCSAWRVRLSEACGRLSALPMSEEQPLMNESKIGLPLVAAESLPSWESWTLAEPLEPQGAYGDGLVEAQLELPRLGEEAARETSTELLAPAGGPEAAYAAFYFGADAIYLGLKKF